VHLVAIASGPGVRELYWPIAKPYQPTSPLVDRRVIGSTGAVWLDNDGDGRRTSALEYAERLLSRFESETTKIIQALGEYDEAVAAQTAGLLHAKGISVQSEALRAEARKAGAHVERGFQAFTEAWRECALARSRRR
jgi:hypothetical protein